MSISKESSSSEEFTELLSTLFENKSANKRRPRNFFKLRPDISNNYRRSAVGLADCKETELADSVINQLPKKETISCNICGVSLDETNSFDGKSFNEFCYKCVDVKNESRSGVEELHLYNESVHTKSPSPIDFKNSQNICDASTQTTPQKKKNVNNKYILTTCSEENTFTKKNCTNSEPYKKQVFNESPKPWRFDSDLPSPINKRLTIHSNDSPINKKKLLTFSKKEKDVSFKRTNSCHTVQNTTALNGKSAVFSKRKNKEDGVTTEKNYVMGRNNLIVNAVTQNPTEDFRSSFLKNPFKHSDKNIMIRNKRSSKIEDSLINTCTVENIANINRNKISSNPKMPAQTFDDQMVFLNAENKSADTKRTKINSRNPASPLPSVSGNSSCNGTTKIKESQLNINKTREKNIKKSTCVLNNTSELKTNLVSSQLSCDNFGINISGISVLQTRNKKKIKKKIGDLLQPKARRRKSRAFTRKINESGSEIANRLDNGKTSISLAVKKTGPSPEAKKAPASPVRRSLRPRKFPSYLLSYPLLTVEEIKPNNRIQIKGRKSMENNAIFTAPSGERYYIMFN